MRVFIFIILIFLLNQVNAHSIHEQFRFKSLTIDNGLISNRTTCVTKDKDGFIWIGTDDGIARFDGLKLKNYELISDAPEKNERNREISSILTDSKGEVWIGAYDLYYYNYEKDSLAHFLFLDLNDPPVRIKGMYNSLDNKMWIGAQNGLYCIDLITMKATKIVSNTLKNDYKIQKIVIHNNKVWLATNDNGLVYYDLNLKQYVEIPIKVDQKNYLKFIYEVFVDNNNILWLGTREYGIYTLDPVSNKVLSHEFPDTNTIRIRSIVQDKHGNYWIGTKSGLFVKYRGQEKYIKYAHNQHIISNLTQNAIVDIYIDNHDIMWLSSFSGGINYADMFNKNFVLYTTSEQNKQFLNDQIVLCISEDDHGNLYLGSDNGGMFIFNPQKDLISKIKFNHKGLNGSKVQCFAIDKLKNVWIGFNNLGVAKFNHKTSKLTFIEANPSDSSSIINSIYNSIVIDKDQNVWIAGDQGVDMIDSKTNKIKHIIKKKGYSYLYYDHKGEIWLGYSGAGLFLLNKKTQQFEQVFKSLLINSVISLCRDPKENLWIGSKNGLKCLSLIDSSIYTYTKNDNLPSNSIFSIHQSNNNLWLSTSIGLAHCINAVESPHKFQINSYIKLDGEKSMQFWRNSSFVSSSGLFYFGGVEGFVGFDPQKVVNNPHKPQLAITGIKIFNKPVEINQNINGRVLFDKNINYINEIILRNSEKIVTIDFAALHFSDANSNKYKYRLYPLEKEWINTVAPQNFATYTSIPAGNYTFEVKAANCDDVWNYEMKSFNLVIVPLVWNTSWFRALAVLLIGLIIFAFIFWRTQSNYKQRIKLEKIVEERTSEIKMINSELFERQKELLIQSEKLQTANNLKDKFFSIIAHDLKSPFQALLGFSELLQKKYTTITEEKRQLYVKSIYSSSKKIYNLLENLLTWARTQNDGAPFEPIKLNLSEIVLNNIKLVEEKCKNKKIIIQDNFKDDLFVSGDFNMIHSIFRNLISNAIKFSYENGVIDVFYFIKENVIEISVKDQGIGIDNESIDRLFEIGNSVSRLGTNGEEGTGLGLLLTYEFIIKHGGKIWVESILGQGTVFTFTLPYNK